MVVRDVFIILAFVSFASLVLAIRLKRRNLGYIFATALVVICDIICVMLLGSNKIHSVKPVLTAYYVCHAWLFFGVFSAIAFAGRRRFFAWYYIPIVLLCIYQTILILNGNVLRFRKHILFGDIWWIAQGNRSDSLLWSFNSYWFASAICFLAIITISIINCVKSARFLRNRYYILIALQILLSAFEVFVYKENLPVWIPTIAINLIWFLGFYYFNLYANAKLRYWALMHFANEMSDGFILYNQYDDLIHMNEIVKNNIEEDVVKSFEEKSRFESWAAEMGSEREADLLVYEKEGQNIYFKLRENVVSKNERVLATIYILHDTTESMNQIRIMQKANDELERAAKMKSDFLANMSHEIRTPMNAVIGMAEIALREELPDHVADCLSQIQRSGKSLLNIINDILDFSKIEAGKMEIIPDDYEPLAEIKDIANILMTRIGDKELELFVKVDPNIPHKLHGDAQRIRQVLINLVNNAIKFTNKGVVHIDISCEKQSEDKVVLTYHVVDTGAGIKEEDMNKLFKSFQQVDSKRNRSVEGTGLGLAISQRLCEAMGGSIGVTSEYGKGSDFYFMIPQIVVDDTKDLVVEDAENKMAYCIDEKSGKTDMFEAELRQLSVEAKIIRSLDEYTPTGKHEFIFIDQKRYDDNVRRRIEENENCRIVILTEFASEYKPDHPNIRIMMRPQTTMNMVTVLNDKNVEESYEKKDNSYVIDFEAPDAKILVVDDNEVNIMVVKGFLAPIKANCDSAQSGVQAIEKIQKNEYDLVLMDHMMPEMDGVEAAGIIRDTIAKEDELPILAVSANVMEDARNLFASAGMNDFVAKPIDIRDLVEKVKQWLPKDKILARTGVEDVPEEAREMPQYDGLDTASVIDKIGSFNLYEQIVEQYYKMGGSDYENIKKVYEEEDWGAYKTKVHALKSSSRQIGGMELGDIAELLERASIELNLDVIHANHEKMLSMYRELLDKLSKYFEEEEDEKELMPITQEIFDELSGRLAEACDELDMDGMEEVAQDMKSYQYPDEMKENLDKLYLAIDNIDIDGCEEIMEQLKQYDL